MFYDRKIKYIHMYEKDEKIQNVGFVKLEVVEDKVNVYVHIAGLRHTDKEECRVMAKGKETEIALGEICLEYGRGSMDINGLATEQMAEGIPYGELSEIYVNLSTGAKLRCIIQEICEEKREVILQETSERIIEEVSEEFVDVDSEENVGNAEEMSEAELLREAFAQERHMLETASKEEPMSTKVNPQILQPEESMIMAADKWQQLWALYPHMKPFEDGREYLVVKPRDFVILQNKYYTLSANSFLLHGYYNYEHLIMCRETRKEEERFYIGVPGNFYEKEKQVAVLFGFESFEGKQEPAGNGDFGYYMVRVEI